MITEQDKDRFRSKVNKTNTCWIWEGTITHYGYGQFKADGTDYRAHRLSYLWTKGNIPDDLVLDHTCRNKKCVNPDHLEAITSKENILKGEGITAVNARKTHCDEGHELIQDNLYIDKFNKRRCLTCHRERQAEYLLKQKERNDK